VLRRETRNGLNERALGMEAEMDGGVCIRVLPPRRNAQIKKLMRKPGLVYSLSLSYSYFEYFCRAKIIVTCDV
jgi:hypothetical protein